MVKFSFLLPQYTFCCYIMKRGHTGIYELTSIIGPSSPPTNFRLVAVGPDSVGVSWDPPPLEAQNGNIIAYTLTCQPEELLEVLPTTYLTAGNYSLSGFSPATTYNCTLYAMKHNYECAIVFLSLALNCFIVTFNQTNTSLTMCQ